MRSLWIAKQTKKNSLLVLLLFAACAVAAQPRTVTGKVSSDTTNEPLQGVTKEAGSLWLRASGEKT